MKVAIVGAPCTGKTILTRALTNELCLRGHNADMVSEYVQGFLSRYIRPFKMTTDLLDQVMIFRGQREREDDLSHKDIIVCDSSTFLIYVYTLFRKFSAESERNRMVIKEMRKDTLRDLPGYTKVLYLPPFIPYKKNSYQWTTALENDRRRLDEKLRAFFTIEDIPFCEITATDIKGRLDQSIAAISDSLPDLSIEN
jgi:nicotinamide riboside kinase